MNITSIIRQGDLSFIPLDESDAELIAAARRDLGADPEILALGEESGHWHEISGGVTSMVGDQHVLVVPGPGHGILTVQPESHAGRHAPIEIQPGAYLMPGQSDPSSIWLGQREYTPEAIRGAGD